MRLLLITSVFPSPRRPVKGTFNRDLVFALRDAGDDVRVIVPVPWTDLLRTRATAAPVAGATYPVWWYPPRIGHATHHRWMSRSIVPATLGAADSWRPDLILGYWTHPDGTVAVEAARQLRVPSVVFAGGSDILVLTQSLARREVIVDTLRAANRVLTVGTPLRDAVVALGVPAARVGIFARGVNRQRFHPASPATARRHLGLPEDRPIVVWVGRMVPVKGLDVLLESWRAVATHPARPLLLLIGDGEQRGPLKRQAAALGDSVRFIGAMAHDALPDWYRAADCVVLPSRSEGVPNVLLEGLACGTPFVASAVGGVSVLVDEESVAVPPGDATALAKALLARIALPPMTHRAHVEVPDSGTTVTALRLQLREVLDAARPSAAHVA